MDEFEQEQIGAWLMPGDIEAHNQTVTTGPICLNEWNKLRVKSREKKEGRELRVKEQDDKKLLLNLFVAF